MVKHKIYMGKYTEKQNHNVKYKGVNLIRNKNNNTQFNSSSSNNVVTVSLQLNVFTFVHFK